MNEGLREIKRSIGEELLHVVDSKISSLIVAQNIGYLVNEAYKLGRSSTIAKIRGKITIRRNVVYTSQQVHEILDLMEKNIKDVENNE